MNQKEHLSLEEIRAHLSILFKKITNEYLKKNTDWKLIKKWQKEIQVYWPKAYKKNK